MLKGQYPAEYEVLIRPATVLHSDRGKLTIEIRAKLVSKALTSKYDLVKITTDLI